MVSKVPSFGREFEFIDERERLQSPALRKAVRSIARKHSHSSGVLRRVRPTGFLLPRRREPEPEPTLPSPESGQKRNVHIKLSAKPKTRKRAAHCLSSSTSARPLKEEEEYLLQRLPSPPMILEAGSTDPFHSLPMKMQPYMYGLLEHCKEYFLLGLNL